MVEGPLLAKGYLDDPVTTNSKFIRAPHWLRQMRGDKEGKCYKTGDMGYYDADGTVSFVGRADNQVKVRGQRIELEEIEHNISLLEPSFNQVVVEAVTLKRHKRSQTLAAFVDISHTRNKDKINGPGHGRATSLPVYLNGLHNGVAAHTKDNLPNFALPMSQSMTDIFRQCQQKVGELLPRIMVPSLFFPMQNLPLASTGKLDRKALRRWAANLSDDDLARYQEMTTAASREPEKREEKCLQHLWSRVLGVAEANLGAGDHFLRLGGDSVMAMELVSRLRNEGKSLTVQQVFENPRLCNMATQLGSIDKLPAHEAISAPFVLTQPKTNIFECICEAAQACHIHDVSMIEDIYPVTPMQEAVLAVSAHRAGAYRHQATLKLPNTLHLKRFVWAWERLIAMHSIFRTRVVFLQDYGLLQIVICPGVTWRTSSSLEQYLREDDQSPIGCGTELSRFALVTDRDSGETYFVWSGHHAIYDGWSLPRAFEEVARIYQGQSLRQVVPFNSFIKHITQLDIVSAHNYWRGQFPSMVESYPCLPSSDYVPHPSRVREATIPLRPKGESAFTAATTIRQHGHLP